MRKLITVYNVIGDHQISTPNDSFTKEQVRLIVNETQKKVLTSSMQKDLLLSTDNNIITLSDLTPALVFGDILTIEISNSDVLEDLYNMTARTNIVGDQELRDYLNNLD